jgi:hypothetical protein
LPDIVGFKQANNSSSAAFVLEEVEAGLFSTKALVVLHLSSARFDTRHALGHLS